MDPFNVEKVKAINRSRRRLVLYHKLQCSLAALTCSLFCSSPLWLPAISSSLKVFLFVSLPKFGSVLLSTKVVFIIGNLIVVLLVVETKLLSSKSSSIDVCYYEHIKRSEQRTEGPSKVEVSEGGRLITPATLRDQVIVEEDGLQVMDCHGRGWGARAREVETEEENLCGGDDIDDDEGGDPTTTRLSEDLSRRADEFIERVNSQRRLELILIDHCDCYGEFTQTY